MLSIIIVNYNVKYYLEHCLRSVLIACHGIKSEIIVIDNASTDGSKDLIPSLFPEIKYECQSENLGFSKANNLGIEISRGDYVLLLNPDTVVPEDCFTTCVQFMKDNGLAYWDRLLADRGLYQVFVRDPNGVVVELNDYNPDLGAIDPMSVQGRD